MFNALVTLTRDAHALQDLAIGALCIAKVWKSVGGGCVGRCRRCKVWDCCEGGRELGTTASPVLLNKRRL